eukprot:RCo022953
MEPFEGNAPTVASGTTVILPEQPWPPAYPRAPSPAQAAMARILSTHHHRWYRLLALEARRAGTPHQPPPFTPEPSEIAPTPCFPLTRSNTSPEGLGLTSSAPHPMGREEAATATGCRASQVEDFPQYRAGCGTSQSTPRPRVVVPAIPLASRGTRTSVALPVLPRTTTTTIPVVAWADVRRPVHVGVTMSVAESTPGSSPASSMSGSVRAASPIGEFRLSTSSSASTQSFPGRASVGSRTEVQDPRRSSLSPPWGPLQNNA